MKPILPLLLASVLAVAPAVRSAEPKASAEAVASAPSAPPVFFNLNFPGGPLSALAEALSSVKGISVSLIAADDAAELSTQLPPFELRNATVATVAQVLHPLLFSRGFGFEFAPGADVNSLVGVVRHREPDATAASRTREAFVSFRLTPYLVGQSVDDIVAAIRTAWELDPAHAADALKIKFHPPTSLLLVSGPPEAIGIATNVLAQLPRAPAGAPPPSSATYENPPAGTEVYDLSQLDQAPAVKFQARPEYPPAMLRSRMNGEVVVDFVVDPNGDVRAPHAVRSSNPAFEAPAVAAVSKWKFRPGRKEGRTVAAHLQVPLVFTLDSE